MPTDRTDRMWGLRSMIVRANKVLQHNRAKPGSEAYMTLRAQLDIPSYLPAVAAWLAVYDMPQIKIKPNASAKPDPRYKDRLQLFGSVFIIETAPRIWDRLREIGEESIHISEAVDLMEQYGYLALAHFTINQPGAESKMHRVRQSRTSGEKRGKEGALKRAIRALRPAPANLKSLLKKLGDDAIDDLYRPAEGPSIDIYDFEIDNANESVSYSDSKGKSKTVSFRRLANILSEIKHKSLKR